MGSRTRRFSSWGSQAPVALMLAAASVLPGAAQADTPAQARAAIQAAVRQNVACYSRRDIAGYMAMLAPGFTTVDV